MSMTIERLHDLFDKSDKGLLQWTGLCHDCKTETTITAMAREQGINIIGGAVYEPANEQFFIKCSECYLKNKTLENYQDCEVYTRVVGYLRPVNQFNPGKQQEYNDRVNFSPQGQL